jgi:3D (Asp-Asp-Asp) domain-containing protein
VIPVLAAASLLTASSTAYSPCSSGAVMADGTRTRFGSVASNDLPLHTRIRFTRPVHGRKTFTVRDTGGMGHGVIDIWMADCRAAINYGRRRVRFRVVGHGR